MRNPKVLVFAGSIRFRAERGLEWIARRRSRLDRAESGAGTRPRALVIPDQIAVRETAAGFDATDGLRDERAAKGLRMVLARLVGVKLHHG
jgi:hypothetical protein